jgi:hypothetical protein
MYTNLMIDFVIGLIPVLGDFADAIFKCNTRNNILLEKFLRERGLKNPVAPPPVVPKQSTMRRWLGPGPNAPGSHPAEPATAHPATAIVDHPKVTTGTTKPDLPAQHAATGKTRIVSDHEGNDRDLEAQDEDIIHYSRK